jgi:hypothetical protein
MGKRKTEPFIKDRPERRQKRNWSTPEHGSLPTYLLDTPILYGVVDTDNDAAVRHAAHECGLACALRRQGHPAWVHRTFTYILCRDEEGLYYTKGRTTPLMQRQLTANDQGGHVAAGSYYVGAIPPSGGKPRVKGKRRGTGGGNPMGIHQTISIGPEEVRQRATP